MGLLDNILGICPPEIPQPPVMSSILPSAAISEIKAGRLPILNAANVVLSNGEVCHYIDEACLVTKKIERHYQRRNNGMSFKIAKGMYYHTGDSNSHPIEYEVPVYTKGYLYITNKRIVFTSREKGFDKKLTAISSITPYSDAIGIQSGEKIYNLLLPSPGTANVVLNLLK